jgi:membrane protein DedA with SNARE-associated domain
VVDVHVLAAVAFFAVTGSDFFVYGIGRVFGTRALDSKFMKRFLPDERRQRIEILTAKYGLWAVAAFRFTPGIRFPGHIACGAVGIPATRFLLVDGAAALLSVPTQIYLVAFYGREIMAVLDEIKIGLAVALVGYIIFYFGRKYWRYRQQRQISDQQKEFEG